MIDGIEPISNLDLELEYIDNNNSRNGETHVETPNWQVSVLASIWTHGSDVVSSSTKTCRDLPVLSYFSADLYKRSLGSRFSTF